MTKDKAKLGTVVYIAGSPAMTIAQIDADRHPDNPVKVIWFKRDGNLDHMWVHHEVLASTPAIP